MLVTNSGVRARASKDFHQCYSRLNQYHSKGTTTSDVQPRSGYASLRITARQLGQVRHFSGSPVPRASWQLGHLRNVSAKSSPLIFHSTSTNPYHNLSLEHFLLTNSDHSSRILLFYKNRPCVVIGRNQNPWLECDLSRLQAGLPAEEQNNGSGLDPPVSATGTHTRHDGSSGTVPIDLVRRRSGGGTVFHDSGNLNYSVIVPNDKDFERRKHAQMVVQALSGMKDERFGEVKVNDRNDIVMFRGGEWLKVSGSAFKLTRGRALHHGTLLYSSPSLTKISGLLRSPGRDFIHAMGVESVRSKVGNLRWEDNLQKREDLKRRITSAIVEEFWKTYGNERKRNAEIELSIGDTECQKSQNSSIATAIEEMTTNDFRFGQTPRFEFVSGIVDGVGAKFNVNRGVIEKASLISHPDGIETPIKLRQKTVHMISDWSEAFETAEQQDETRKAGSDTAASQDLSIKPSDALVQQIARVFPAFKAT